MSTIPLTQSPLVIEGVAIAGALAPLAGPYGILADQLIMGGLQYLTTMQAAKMNGTITREMLQPLADLVGSDLLQLENDFAQAEAARKLGFQPVAAGSVSSMATHPTAGGPVSGPVIAGPPVVK